MAEQIWDNYFSNQEIAKIKATVAHHETLDASVVVKMVKALEEFLGPLDKAGVK